jgi:hypothetical protein
MPIAACLGALLATLGGVGPWGGVGLRAIDPTAFHGREPNAVRSPLPQLGGHPEIAPTHWRMEFMPANALPSELQTLRLKTVEGFEAELVAASSELVTIEVPVELARNTCASATPKCTFRIRDRRHQIALVWKSHPDATRINTPVLTDLVESSRPVNKGLGRTNFYDPKSVALNGDDRLEQSAALHLSSHFWDENPSLRAHALAGASPLELVCDSDAWLPANASGQRVERLDVRHWIHQTDVLNPETDAIEMTQLLRGRGIVLMRASATTFSEPALNTGAPAYHPKSTRGDGHDWFSAATHFLRFFSPTREHLACEIELRLDPAAAVFALQIADNHEAQLKDLKERSRPLLLGPAPQSVAGEIERLPGAESLIRHTIDRVLYPQLYGGHRNLYFYPSDGNKAPAPGPASEQRPLR